MPVTKRPYYIPPVIINERINVISNFPLTLTPSTDQETYTHNNTPYWNTMLEIKSSCSYGMGGGR
jgi:hypothetical protein